jgi:hypothetical protein
MSGQRARFDIAAQSPGGLAYYQWQFDGADVAGATRAAYYTEILSPGESGKQVRCIVYAGGVIATSTVATITIVAGPVPTSQPYIGVNFVGGDAAGASGVLRPNDVVGVVPQANFNNISGAAVTETPLVDANGASTPATISYSARTYFTGTGENTAEDVLFQGYLHNANASVIVTLNHVPSGGYDVYAYCVGFTYNATYEQSMSVTGSGTYPTYHVRAEHSTDYSAAPAVFRQMSSTEPNARQQGNYVVFRGVVPDLNGALTLTVGNESDNPLDIDVTPTVSGLQLVKVPPSLRIDRVGLDVEISWDSDAGEYTLESSSSVGPTAVWTPVPGVSSPLIDFGSLSIVPNDAPKYFRLRKP